jgi:diguanylate cyclase (GGDEF)-like protein
MIDIDRFKLVNDRHGHAMGDRVLRSVADAVQASLRRADRAFRYGGEEFVAVVELEPHVSEHEAARAIGERVRAAVAQLDHRGLGIDHPVTVSVGVALVRPGIPLATHVADADEALYAAKHTGRNRVVLLPGG